MATAAKLEILCPRCLASGYRVVMAKTGEGFWSCPQYQSHEFCEDRNMDRKQDMSRPSRRIDLEPDEPAPSGRQRGQVKTVEVAVSDNNDPLGRRCPQCDRPLKIDSEGLFCNAPMHKGTYRPPAQHWLAHIGITTPLPEVRQASSSVNGVNCQQVGDLKLGGGGSSGRRRKKPEAKREPWYRKNFQ